MNRITLLLCLLLFPFLAFSKPGGEREYWVKTMLKMVDPIYTNLSRNTLRKNMPVETRDGLNTGNDRKKDILKDKIGIEIKK